MRHANFSLFRARLRYQALKVVFVSNCAQGRSHSHVSAPLETIGDIWVGTAISCSKKGSYPSRSWPYPSAGPAGRASKPRSLRHDEAPTRDTSPLPAQRVSCRLIRTNSLPVISINIDVNATLTSRPVIWTSAWNINWSCSLRVKSSPCWFAEMIAELTPLGKTDRTRGLRLCL